MQCGVCSFGDIYSWLSKKKTYILKKESKKTYILKNGRIRTFGCLRETIHSLCLLVTIFDIKYIGIDVLLKYVFETENIPILFLLHRWGSPKMVLEVSNIMISICTKLELNFFFLGLRWFFLFYFSF